MIRNRLYYGVKPLIPSSVRMAVRRSFALRKRAKVAGIWPIMPHSEQPPEGWTGWPDGKQFALVLTHDVEGAAGLAKCHAVMEMEQALGVRSAFNLIPEGEYSATGQFRDNLVRNGFEVGVHDLYHDGKLFLTQKVFNRNAAQINHYLADWGAVGFRSGFMLHNLSWLHELNIQYDASTFDVDPFEPQPQGRHTIFPFWVSRPTNGRRTCQRRASGYAELPYTLPQDSTLFLLLKERHPDIWFQKLDWVARHGGMALVNVHPDYMHFGKGDTAPHTYPAEFYERFLQYAQQKYGDRCWQPLPKDLAAFVAKQRFSAPRRPRRICMVTHSFFMSDARVSRYAEALAQRGDHVDVVALRRSPESPAEEKIGNISLFRLRPRYGKQERTAMSHLLPVLKFFAASCYWLFREHRRAPYDLLHIHNVPDFLVFAGWFPKLRGAKVILDIHDIVPEFYASKFGVGQNSLVVRSLKWLERISAGFADHVIISNHLWRDRYAERNQLDGKCSVYINNVDSTVFRPRPRTRGTDPFIVIFPGGLHWHQGLDLAIQAFRQVRDQIPKAELHIYGDGNQKAQLISLSESLNLTDCVRFFKPLPVRQIAEVMANADLGVVPKRADSFGNEAYSTKIMEFMSLGIPVVVASTKIDRFYFDDSVVRFFESGNVEALTQAIVELAGNPELRRRLSQNGLEYAARNNWDSRRAGYLTLVDSLISGFESSANTTPDPFDSKSHVVAELVSSAPPSELASEAEKVELNA